MKTSLNTHLHIQHRYTLTKTHIGTGTDKPKSTKSVPTACQGVINGRRQTHHIPRDRETEREGEERQKRRETETKTKTKRQID